MTVSVPVASASRVYAIARQTLATPTASGSLVDPAALHAPLEIDRDAVCRSLLKGISTGDYPRRGGGTWQGCCRVVRIRHAAGGRRCVDETHACRARLSTKRYVYIWAMASISKHARRRKAVHPGAESRDAGRPARNWRLTGWRPQRARRTGAICCFDMKRRALDVPPRARIAEGALGFGSRRLRSGENARGSAAGCTRPRKCDRKVAEEPAGRRQRACAEIGWPKPRQPPSWRSKHKYGEGGRLR